jgi:hypothetical protein
MTDSLIAPQSKDVIELSEIINWQRPIMTSLELPQVFSQRKIAAMTRIDCAIMGMGQGPLQARACRTFRSVSDYLGTKEEQCEK